MRSLTFLSALLFVFSGCGGLVGSGTVVTREREVGAFRKVSVGNGIRLTGVAGPRAVTVSADDNLVDLIETVSEGDTLNVRLKPDTWVSKGTLVVFAHNDVFEAVEASGGSDVKLSPTAIDTLRLSLSGGSTAELTAIASMRLEADLSGGSDATLSGNAVQATVQASGGSGVKLEGVCLDTLDVQASGGSTVAARVKTTLTGSASGGSTVTVMGAPANQVATSGGSQVSLR